MSTEINEYNKFKSIVPTHALITNVLMKDGKEASITTLFCCSDFSFEEINIGVQKGLERQDWLQIVKSQSTLYSMKDNKPKVCIRFDERKFNKKNNYE